MSDVFANQLCLINSLDYKGLTEFVCYCVILEKYHFDYVLTTDKMNYVLLNEG